MIFGNQSLVGEYKSVLWPFRIRKPTGDPGLLLGNRGVIRIAGVVTGSFQSTDRSLKTTEREKKATESWDYFNPRLLCLDNVHVKFL